MFSSNFLSPLWKIKVTNKYLFYQKGIIYEIAKITE